MARKVKINPETTVTWRDTTGSGTEFMTLANLAAGAGRNGALHDFGAAPRVMRYHYKFFCQFATAPVVGEAVRLYIREADLSASPNLPTNDDGTGDVALSSVDKLRNLKHIDTLIVDEASTSAPMSVEGIFESASRHIGPVVFNDTADNLHGTAANNGFDITPIPDEVQDET